MPTPTPAPPADASATRRGLVNLLAQTFEGMKTFASRIIAQAGVQFSDGSLLTSATPLVAIYGKAAEQVLGGIQGGGGWDALNYDTALFDNLGGVTTGAGWRFTVPAGKVGLYRVEAQFGLSVPIGTDAAIGMRILVNGATEHRLVTQTALQRNNGYIGSPSLGGSTVLRLAEGDFFSVTAAWHGVGGLSIPVSPDYNRLAITYLGAA